MSRGRLLCSSWSICRVADLGIQSVRILKVVGSFRETPSPRHTGVLGVPWSTLPLGSQGQADSGGSLRAAPPGEMCSSLQWHTATQRTKAVSLMPPRGKPDNSPGLVSHSSSDLAGSPVGRVGKSHGASPVKQEVIPLYLRRWAEERKAWVKGYLRKVLHPGAGYVENVSG